MTNWASPQRQPGSVSSGAQAGTHDCRPGAGGADWADAPEVHYGTAAQPLGTDVRDTLLEWMEFKNIQFGENDSDRVQAVEPQSVRGAILSKAAEANGRPISYVLVGEDVDQLRDGSWMQVDEQLLRASLNYRLLETGLAYYTVYSSTTSQCSQCHKLAQST